MYAGESCQHLIITDEREGTEICVICSKVINDCLMIPPKSYTFNNPSKSCAFHEFIRDCCDRIHVLDGDIEKCIICFDEFVQEIKTEKLDKFVIAAYSIYLTLKKENVP